MPNGNIKRAWKQNLCGASEIAAFANVTPSQVAHWRKPPEEGGAEWFPDPVDELRMGSVWDYKAVTKALTEQGYPKEASYVERYPANRKRRKQTQPEDEHEGHDGPAV